MGIVESDLRFPVGVHLRSALSAQSELWKLNQYRGFGDVIM